MTSIHLRPLGVSDLSVLERLAVDPHAAEPFNWYGFGDPGAPRRRLAEDGFLGRDPRRLAVALDQDDSCVGDVSWLAVLTGPASTCWNIGVVILPEFRGKGYGTRAQRLLADYLFATTTANRVEAGTDVENLAEQRALEKAGFLREGVRRRSHFRDGQWRIWLCMAVCAMIPSQRPTSDTARTHACVLARATHGPSATDSRGT